MEDAGSNPVWGSNNAVVMQLEDIPSSEGGFCGLESHLRHQHNAPAAETDKVFETDDGWV